MRVERCSWLFPPSPPLFNAALRIRLKAFQKSETTVCVRQMWFCPAVKKIIITPNPTHPCNQSHGASARHTSRHKKGRCIKCRAFRPTRRQIHVLELNRLAQDQNTVEWWKTYTFHDNLCSFSKGFVHSDNTQKNKNKFLMKIIRVGLPLAVGITWIT